MSHPDKPYRSEEISPTVDEYYSRLFSSLHSFVPEGAWLVYKGFVWESVQGTKPHGRKKRVGEERQNGSTLFIWWLITTPFDPFLQFRPGLFYFLYNAKNWRFVYLVFDKKFGKHSSCDLILEVKCFSHETTILLHFQDTKHWKSITVYIGEIAEIGKIVLHLPYHLF